MTSTSTATERGRFTVRRLVVGVLVPAVVALGALVAVAAPASAATVATTATGSDLVSASTVAPVDTTSPAPTITVSGGATAVSNLAKPTISGTSTGVAGRSATVFIGGQTLTSSISPTGDWSVVPTVALTQSSHRVTVVVWADSGLRATSYQALTVDWAAPAIVISGGSAASTSSHTPTISGRTDLPADRKINVVVDEVAQQAVVSSTLTWSVTPSTLTAGAHTVVVSATDPAGNVGTGRQRLTVIPVLSIDGGASRLTNSPTISGTTDAPSGTPVTVRDYSSTRRSFS